jgi:hypothetical protein
MGFGLATMGAASGTPPLSLAQTDTSALLDVWGETLTVKRRSASYGATGKATVTWITIGTITGDWQPLPGKAIVEEAGLEVKSSSQIYTVYNANVLAGDRIYRADGSYEYVNYLKKHEDHMAIRMKLTEGE